MNVCGVKETVSVECQMSRRQVWLWQMQYELADGLAALILLQTWHMLEQAKNFMDIALDRPPKSSVEMKWKLLVHHKLNLTKIELHVSRATTGIQYNILHNCVFFDHQQKND